MTPRRIPQAVVGIIRLSAAIAFPAFVQAGETGKPAVRPNILFILSDDQQHDTIHALGDAEIQTPNIDSLAKSGVAFTNAYIMGGTSPGVCSPSRACLLTGRTHWNIENEEIWGYEISEKFKTLPEVFRENGYVAFQAPHDPRESPEEFRKRYKNAEMKLPENFMPQHPFNSGAYRDWDEKRVNWPRTGDDIKKHMADYYALITTMDDQIGRIVATLKETNQHENTIIVFASNNGLALGRHGLLGKQNIYEHSVRVPLILSGPGIPKGELRDQLCYLPDINPTLCELTGLRIPETLQHKSLMPVLRHPKATHRDHLYFAYMNWQQAVRDGRFKLIEYCVEDERHTQLFDLNKDPDELVNLAGGPECADQVKALRELLKAERVRLNDGNTPYEFANQQGRYFWSRYNPADSNN